MIQLVAGVTLVSGSLAEAVLFLASAGLVGMGLADLTAGITERFSGGDDGDDGDDGDELGGGDETFDEMGDWDDGDDDLDDWEDDDLDELGGDSGGQSELEPRLDELENEVESISSTMGTVRSENEAINETVEEIEDNIRKLLEIYEMVTRGVNPFVDEPHGGGGGMSGSFGLFEASNDDDEYDDIDPDVAEADPESFFDEDFEEGGLDDEGFDDDEFVSGSVQQGGAPDGDTTSASGPGARDDDADGKTFEDLKSEYESGSEDWSEDAPEKASGTESDADPETWADIEPDAAEETDADGETPSDVDPEEVGGANAADPGRAADGERQDEPSIEDDQPASEGEPDRGTASGPSTESEPGRLDESAEIAGSGPSGVGVAGEEGAAQPPAEGAGDPAAGRGPSEDTGGGKPYLESLPSGFGAELLVVEWLAFLRERSTTAEALRAIEYYQTIGWIGDPAAESLQRYLAGLAEGDAPSPSAGRTQLTIDHHTNSLHYIGELGGRHVDVERLEWASADGDGGIERREQRGIQR